MGNPSTWKTTHPPLKNNWKRLPESFQFWQLKPPFKPVYEEVESRITEVAAANRIHRGGRVRITFYRSTSGFYTPTTDQCGFLIQCNPLLENTFEENRTGLHITLYPHNTKPALPLYALKTLNSLIYVLAGIFARNNQCDDAMIINDYSNIIETTSSNLFIVKENAIITPGLHEGCIPGVMRKNVLKIIENKTDYRLERRNISQKEITEADEIFLTNAIKGIQWVVAFREKRFYRNVSSHLLTILTESLSA